MIDLMSNLKNDSLFFFIFIPKFKLSVEKNLRSLAVVCWFICFMNWVIDLMSNLKNDSLFFFIFIPKFKLSVEKNLRSLAVVCWLSKSYKSLKI